MGVIEFCGYVISLGERFKGFADHWLKDMLIWEKDLAFVFLEKVISVYTPSRVIWIRYENP